MTIIIFLSSLLGAMALGMPIAFALIGCGLAMMLYMGITDPQIVIQNMWDGANSFPLLAVPFFMLAGEFMNAGGMTRRIIVMAMSWIGHIRGGLGYVAVGAAVIMASLSGSAVADTAALASVLIPLMMTTGNTSAHRALRVSCKRSGKERFGSTFGLSRLMLHRQARRMDTPMRMPGTMPAMNSLVIETPPATPKTIIPIDGGITGAMIPPQAIRPQDRSML